MIDIHPVLKTFMIAGIDNNYYECHESIFIKELVDVSKQIKYDNSSSKLRYYNYLLNQIDPRRGDAIMLLLTPVEQWENFIKKDLLVNT